MFVTVNPYVLEAVIEHSTCRDELRLVLAACGGLRRPAAAAAAAAAVGHARVPTRVVHQHRLGLAARLWWGV